MSKLEYIWVVGDKSNMPVKVKVIAHGPQQIRVEYGPETRRGTTFDSVPGKWRNWWLTEDEAVPKAYERAKRSVVSLREKLAEAEQVEATIIKEYWDVLRGEQ